MPGMCPNLKCFPLSTAFLPLFSLSFNCTFIKRIVLCLSLYAIMLRTIQEGLDQMKVGILYICC